jgi:hypothetical protein
VARGLLVRRVSVYRPSRCKHIRAAIGGTAADAGEDSEGIDPFLMAGWQQAGERGLGFASGLGTVPAAPGLLGVPIAAGATTTNYKKLLDLSLLHPWCQ